MKFILSALMAVTLCVSHSKHQHRISSRPEKEPAVTKAKLVAKKKVKPAVDKEKVKPAVAKEKTVVKVAEKAKLAAKTDAISEEKAKPAVKTDSAAKKSEPMAKADSTEETTADSVAKERKVDSPSTGQAVATGDSVLIAQPDAVPAPSPAPAQAQQQMPAQLPEQGFEGRNVRHADKQTMISDWRQEYKQFVADATKTLPWMALAVIAMW